MSKIHEMWESFNALHPEDKLTFREIARNAGITEQTLLNAMNGKNVTVKTLHKIAHTLECSIHDLIDDEE